MVDLTYGVRLPFEKWTWVGLLFSGMEIDTRL